MAIEVDSLKKNMKNRRKGSEEQNTNDIMNNKKNGQIRKNLKEPSHTISTKLNAFTLLIFIFLTSFLTLLIGILLIEMNAKQMGIADLIHIQFYKEDRQNLTKNPNESLWIFNKLLETNPKNVEALLGKAKSLYTLADVEKSNETLEEAIATYALIVDIAEKSPGTVPKDVLMTALETCAEIMTSRGWKKKAVSMLETLERHFPDEPRFQNKLGHAYLKMNDTASAKKTFYKVLQQWPEDGFAQIFDEGVDKGFFLSRYQRSFYNIDRLKSRPIWTIEQTTYENFFNKLAANWKKILEEGLKVLQLSSEEGFVSTNSFLRKSGQWYQFILFNQGEKIDAACSITPFTCSLIESFPDVATNHRGEAKFSMMKPGTIVYKHTGPTNCRLRSHLGLIIPPGAKMKVLNTELTWKAGEIIIFDDSFEHEVLNEGDSLRLILIVDVWHPEITYEEKLTLFPI